MSQKDNLISRQAAAIDRKIFIQRVNKCCDNCIHYHWYYDYCDKYDCEVDAREVHDCFTERREE